MNTFLIWISSFLAISPAFLPLSATTPSVSVSQEEKMEEHSAWDQLLREHVSSSGKVDYAGFKQDKSKLDAYITSLQKNAPSGSWSKNKQMAFWINLYNAYTIQLIVENYPTSSILKISGGKVWTTKTINVGGRSYTLDNIEKVQLIKQFNEPRVHFAVNCAAASCPPLLNRAWTEDNIQRYFEERAKLFINDSKYNTLGANSVQLSQIFNWYAHDFGGKANLVNYIKKYAKTAVNSGASVQFKTYNWDLNKQ